MEDALYGPDGFYSSGGSAGRRGDFITSPEVGPLFGAVIANFIDAEWERLGRPGEFVVVDAGAGPGTLARGVMAARPACAAAMRYVAVELSAPQRGQHPSGVESRVDLPPGPFDGVIIANELLDNLPFRLAVFDDGWREAHAVEDRYGRFVEELNVFDTTPDVLPATASLGARAPIQDAAAAWVEEARRRVGRGAVVVIDYAVPTTAELASRPWREWLRTYRGHERGGHYLATPGAQDITADVAIDQLPEPDAVRTQQQWLQLHGIAQLVDEGKVYWAANAASPGLAALTMRSRIGEAEALLDPHGLGGFTVMEWRSG
jgi:SAM-dependent MidA family methyltransferase